MQTLTRSFMMTLSLLAIGSTSVIAATGGVIHFRGQIVEGPCDYQPSSKQIHVNCYEKTRNVEQTVPINALIQGRVISNDKSTARLQWVDRAKKLAILSVEYK